MTRNDSRLLSVEEARDAVLREAAARARPAGRSVPLAQATGRVLAQPVRAADDYPPFDRAVMDGFAVRAADAAAGVELPVIGEVHAGRPSGRGVGPGECLRINTGAPMPNGADAVVPVERVAFTTEGTNGPAAQPRIRLTDAVPAGRHVAPRGSIARAGDVVVPDGARIDAAALAAAIAAGAAEAVVFERPAVAILSTGDELVSVGRPASPGQIYDATGPAVAELVRALGGEPAALGIIADDPAVLRRAVDDALRRPIVVALGGMSRGTRDLVPETFAAAGVNWRFRGVAVRPGRPVGFGVGPGGQLVFGLPGNPASTFVCFELFVRPAIEALTGRDPSPLPRWVVRLAEPLEAARDPRPAFLPGRLSAGPEGAPEARPVPWGGSGDPFCLARANALLWQRRGDAPMDAGQPVGVIPLGGET